MIRMTVQSNVIPVGAQRSNGISYRMFKLKTTKYKIPAFTGMTENM